MGKYGILPGSKEDIFGFDPGKGRFEQLKDLLEIGDESEIEALRDEIDKLAHKHLNMNAKLNSRFQRRSLDNLEKELLAKRPDRWGGEDSAKKLYFARRAAMVVHWAKRHSFATKQKENTSIKKKQERVHVQASSPAVSHCGTGFSSELSELEDSDDEPLARDTPSNQCHPGAQLQQVFHGKLEDSDDEPLARDTPCNFWDSGAQLKQTLTSSEPRFRTPLISGPHKMPHKFGPSAVSDAPAVLPNTKPETHLDDLPKMGANKKPPCDGVKDEKGVLSGSGLPNDPIIIKDEEGNEVPQPLLPTLPRANNASVLEDELPKSFIDVFLSTCKPPMNHHLRLFEDFGPHADWETTLRSLALDWSAPNRQDLLRQILAGLEKNQPVMELDIAILENHFKTYFH